MVSTERAEGEPIRLSFVQEWYAQHPGRETSAILLNGPLQKEVLEQSLSELVRRHETLRTTYPLIDGTPVPTIAPPTQVTLSVESLETLPESERMDEALRLAREEMHHRKLDLERGPIFHIRLLRLFPEQHLIIVVVPVIITDGWAQVLFFRELGEIYDAFAAGQSSPLPDLPIQYADFTTWQRRSIQGATLETFLNYWKQQLVGAPGLDLPTDIPRSTVTQFQEDQLRLVVPEQLAKQLRELSRAEECTLFMTLFAVFQLLMCSFTGQRDLVIGIEISSRNLPETQNLLGVFTHMLPVRMRIEGNPSFRELLKQLRGVMLDVYSHQGIPVERLVELCDPERDLRKDPLICATIAYLNEDVLLSSLNENTLFFSKKKPKLLMTTQRLIDQEEQEDLNMQVRDIASGLMLDLVYHVGLYQHSTISRLLDSYYQLLTAITANPEQSISELLQIL